MRHGHKWGNKLRGCGFRLTIGREAIVDILSHTNSHMSAEDIFFALHADSPNIGLTTVYRTLELLEKNGIVSKYEFGHGRAKFELTEAYGNKPHHHHLICRKCGTIIDYSDFMEDELAYLKKTEAGLGKKYKFTIHQHSISFFGICEKCGAS
ncbi:MAG: transcriptional repressor [Spirochaetales bacterium]|nr:transcriptional repressor [Spirochaetales bacterium]